jgi:hypothetical protein
MRRRVLQVFAATAVLALPSLAQAQLVCVGINSCTVSPTASLTIPKLVVLGVTSSTVTLNTPDFATDSLNAQAPSTTFSGISVRANHPWTLTISSAAATWTYTPAAGASGGVRAREDLEFQVNCAGAWADVTGTGQAIASGAITNAASANVCLRTDFPNDYTNVKNRPGTYTLALTLTLAAN